MRFRQSKMWSWHGWSAVHKNSWIIIDAPIFSTQYLRRKILVRCDAALPAWRFLPIFRKRLLVCRHCRGNRHTPHIGQTDTQCLGLFKVNSNKKSLEKRNSYSLSFTTPSRIGSVISHSTPLNTMVNTSLSLQPSTQRLLRSLYL